MNLEGVIIPTGIYEHPECYFSEQLSMNTTSDHLHLFPKSMFIYRE